MEKKSSNLRVSIAFKEVPQQIGEGHVSKPVQKKEQNYIRECVTSFQCFYIKKEYLDNASGCWNKVFEKIEEIIGYPVGVNRNSRNHLLVLNLIFSFLDNESDD